EGDAVEEGLADVDREADHRRQREGDRRRANDTRGSLHGLGLAREQQRDGATAVGEMERLKRVVEHQYCDFVHTSTPSLVGAPDTVKSRRSADNLLASAKVAKEKGEVRRALGEPAHEVAIPVLAVRDEHPEP